MRPDFAEALNNRGNTLQALMRFEDALASYEQALAVQSNYAEALNNRGNTLQALKRFEDALASYDQALAVRPKYAEALNNRGNTLREVQRSVRRWRATTRLWPCGPTMPRLSTTAVSFSMS